MGLTKQSVKEAASSENLDIKNRSENEKVIAIAGNPNVGKSTVFNSLTGLRQHTGNWPGKTVANAKGEYEYKDVKFNLIDIPGTYSLMANSVEEEIARDFICFEHPDTVIVVMDATCLERNLNLTLQILEVTKKVVVCVNLMDEAKKKKINIDLDELSLQLGVPVVGTSACKGEGLDELIEQVYYVSCGIKKTFSVVTRYDTQLERSIKAIKDVVRPIIKNKMNVRWVSIRLLDMDKKLNNSINECIGYDLLENEKIMSVINDEHERLNDSGIKDNMIRDEIVGKIVKHSEDIYNKCVELGNKSYNERDRKIDRILTSPKTGIPVMILLLMGIFWLTITGSNYPSELIASGLFWVQDQLTVLFQRMNAPDWLYGVLVLGMYRTLAWVVSVMLPPMAIFFPLFTLLEDIGYLPRVAFNMDKMFKKVCAHGKQALTMCMGFGCNACGVIGCRIIESPRERLIAIITNNFVPCNGRFPTLISIITMFFVGAVIAPLQSITSTLILTAVILFGIAMTFLLSSILSKTILKGVPSSFTLELPPYRCPQVGKVIVRSIFDRTIFVLARAMVVAAPAGVVIWLMSNIYVNNTSILLHCANFLDPFAKLVGMDGVILMAFILGFPANEIVVPIIIMSYMCTGSINEFDSLSDLYNLLVANGWTWVTAICTMLFSLMHFPCGTTCWTIKKETGSWKWTALSFLIPTIMGLLICFIVANVCRFIV